MNTPVYPLPPRTREEIVADIEATARKLQHLEWELEFRMKLELAEKEGSATLGEV